MAFVDLSRRDINVLEKIKDPESDPSLAVQVDPTLPKDPYISDPEEYQQISQQERNIILSIQKAELQQAKQRSSGATDVDIVAEYRKCVSRLGELVQSHPQYASARNNRAQALRRLYGDSMLVADAPRNSQALLQSVDDGERIEAAKTVLGDLDHAISLLTPKPYSRLSPQVARTLSNAHTQRAAIYLMTSKLLVSKSVSMDAQRPEAQWTKLDFEERASRDFAMGGRYGNEIAKGLAVSTNPTAKLCGQMVREAMKKEYGSDYAS
ncbi:hypothetical protein BT67DRAFT_452073 [Trichocladium antarcticum]|uniref:Tetratricopeptide repeat protein 36 n=1 Tax=Trichocladium antarcticum TaxID=1450529 RepID=A0AAN6UDV3_9PEZI|nr:hypothetical protein BT67DRAFT_452073 [Trichocladium antarcticum]